MVKADNRAQILLAAGPIFARQGYQATTVRAICQAADVNVAAVNYYFGDKERLYIEAVKHARQLIERRWPLPDWPPSLSADERLRSLIHTFVHRLLCTEREEWQMQLVLREVIEPTRACQEMVQEGFQPFFETLLAILRELTSARLQPARLHQLGFSIIGQCVFYSAHHRCVELMIDQVERDEHFGPQALAAHIYDFSRAALEQFHVADPDWTPVKTERNS